MKHPDRSVFSAALIAASVIVAAVVIRPAPATYAAASNDIAVCAVFRIVDELMSSERYLPQREALERRLRDEKLAPLAEEMEDLELRSREADEDERSGLQREAFRLRQRAQRIENEIRQEIEALLVVQLRECYELVRSSAVAVADDLGYTYVMSSLDPEEEIKADTVNRFLQGGLGRPMLMSPEDADITEDVRSDLKL
ncbi:MAG: hypothetical protein AAGD00_07380 [Planctomycetota bacterium]